MPSHLPATAIPRIALFVVLFTSSIVGPMDVAGQAVPDTLVVNLRTAVLRALSVSPDLREVVSKRDFAEARSRFAEVSRLFPVLEVRTGHAIAPSLKRPNPEVPDDALYLDPSVRNDWSDFKPYNQIEADLVQPVFTWGQVNGSVEAARKGLEVEEGSVESKQLAVAVRTAEVYSNVLLADELLRLAENKRDVVEQAETEISRLLEEGDADDADLFRLQITKQEFIRAVVEVNQNYLTALMALNRQLMVPEGIVVVIEKEDLEPIPFVLESLDHYLALAMENRPELRQVQAGIAARESLVKVARSDYFPKIFVGFSGTYRYTQGRPRPGNPYITDTYHGRGFRGGVVFQQKLNFSQTKAQVDQARAELDQVRHQMDAANQFILFEVEQAYRDVIIAQSAVETQNQALILSREWLRTEYINFDLELGDTDNLVKAVRENLELEGRYYQAVHKHNMAVLRLFEKTGTLVTLAESGILVEE